VIGVPALQSQDEVKKANKEKDRALMKVRAGVRKGIEVFSNRLDMSFR
jgi:hypothetical protein